MWNQLPVVVLYVCEDVSHGVVDVNFRAIADIREICLLECGKNLLDEGLVDSRHFLIEMHFLGVCDSHV